MGYILYIEGINRLDCWYYSMNPFLSTEYKWLLVVHAKPVGVLTHVTATSPFPEEVEIIYFSLKVRSGPVCLVVNSIATPQPCVRQCGC